MSQQFRTVTTNAGRNAVREALTQGKTVKLSHMSVGDGGGNPVTPLSTMTKLVNERFRAQINDIVLDPATPDLFTSELFIPQAEGGWYIREVGLWMDDGTLFAVGNTPLTEKPDISSGAATDLLVRLIIRVLDAATISIEIDPAQVLATREYVDRKLDAHNNDGGAHETLARKSVQIKAGTGLTGGGTLEADRTLTVKYGNTAGTACQGNDVRLSDARTPKAHKDTHKAGGSDALTPGDIGAASKAVEIIAGTGLSGGGPLSGDVALSAKVDGKTTQAVADGAITVKDVAIGGDLGDLASARSLPTKFIKGLGSADCNTIAENMIASVYQNGTSNGPGFASVLLSFFSSAVMGAQAAFISNSSTIVRASLRSKSASGYSPWSDFLMSGRVGDGINVNNGIPSVPEMQGATASAAGTSGLVPPAKAGQHKMVLTGSGEYEPALLLIEGAVADSIAIKDFANAIETAPSANTERGVFLVDKNGNIMGGFDVIQRASDNAKWTQIFAKNSKGQFTTLSIDIKEDGVGEVNSTSPIQINDVRISRFFANDVRLISLSGARGNEGLAMRYSPDSGELYLDGRAMHGKADAAIRADTAGHADTAGTATDPTKLPLSGGTVTGVIAIKDLANAIGTAPPASTERGVFLVDKNDNIMGGFDVIQRASDNAKWAQIFAKNSKGQFTTLSIDINEDGTGEVNSTSPVQINDVRISRVFADGVRLISLSGARGNEGLSMRYSPDNGELYLDGRAMHGKADTAGHADTAQSAYGLMGMEMIIWKETFKLPGYGTWKYMYWASTEGSGGDMVIGEDPGGTVLRYPTPGKFMDGIAFRSA